MTNFRKFISVIAVVILGVINLLAPLSYADAAATARSDLLPSDFNRNPLMFAMPHHDIYLYAVTEPNDYYVAFNGNTSTLGEMNPQKFVYDQEQALNENLYSKIGYTFSGWNEQENGGGIGYTDGQVVKNLAESGTINLYAQWDVNSYNITYNLNDTEGSSSGQINPIPETLKNYGEELTVSNPSRSGYVFSGWDISGMDTEEHTIGSTTSNETSLFGVMVESFRNLRATSGTVEFLAKWSAALTPYKVNHCKESLNSGDEPECIVEDLSGYTDQPATPAISGYNGFTSPDETQTKLVTADGNTEFTYNYTRNSYDLTVVVGTGVVTAKGTGTINTAGVTANESSSDTKQFKFEEPVALSYELKLGYTGAVWSGYSGTAFSFTMPYENITKEVYATPISYTIYADYKGGTGDNDSEISYTTNYTIESENVTLPTPHRDHSIFSGWIAGAGTTEPTTPDDNLIIYQGSIGDRTYEAVWDCVEGYHMSIDGNSCEANTYTININYNDEDQTNTGIIVAYDHPETIPNPTKSGYIFSGWRIEGINGSHATVDDSTPLSAPTATTSGTVFNNLTVNENGIVTFTAEWIDAEVTYKVHYMIEDLNADTYNQSGDVVTYTGVSGETVQFDTLYGTYIGFTYTGGHAYTETPEYPESPSGVRESSVEIDRHGATHIYLYFTRNVLEVITDHDYGIASITGAGKYKYGADVTVTATAKTGYHFVQWTGSPVPAPSSVSGS